QDRPKKSSDHEYILLPLMSPNSPFSSSTQSSDDKDTNEVQGKEDERVCKGSRIDDSERDDSITQDINTAEPRKTDIFDDREIGAEADTNNLEISTVVYKLEKALYGLHQAPRAWYETLSTHLLENRFQRGIIDKTLVIKKDKDDILLVQMYVDDIIFRYIKKSLCDEFEKIMHKRFEMSSIGEFTFFLGLQVKQKDDGIFISQDKYVVDILNNFDFATVKIASTLIKTNKALVKDEEAEDVDVYLYKSMIRSLMYLTASRPDIMFVVCACARCLIMGLTS
nr:putative ribonuclease H-like domain-containing protein [Tanacetum cinerariifolium]